MKSYYWTDIANATRMGQYLTKKEAKFIGSCCPKDWRMVLLDIGGTGRFNEITPSRPYLIDINLVPLRRSLERGSIPICADAEKMPFRSSSFDLVLAIEELQALNCGQFLKEAHRVLKNKGRLLLSTSNRTSYKKLAQKTFGSMDTYKMGYGGLKRDLEKAGFAVLKSRGFHWFPARRASNNPLIPLWSSIESALGLEFLPSISPWIFICAEKQFEKEQCVE